MGDHREQFVDVETSAELAGHRADEVRSFLRRRGLAEPHAVAEDERWPRATVDQAGPAWRSAWHEVTTGPQPSWWRTVTVVTPAERSDQVFVAMDGTGPASCGTCGERFDEAVFWAAFEAWYESGREPVLMCGSCGTAALLGDQDTTGSAVLGRVAVVTRGGTREVAVEMLEALRSDLGGRWAYVELNG